MESNPNEPKWAILNDDLEGRDAHTIQKPLDAREFRGNNKSPICPRSWGNDHLVLSCPFSVAAPLVCLHEVSEFSVLAWVAVTRKKSHDTQCNFESVWNDSLGARKAVLNDFNRVDNGICAVPRINGRSRVVVLHIVSGPMAFTHGSSKPWDA
jgi:hypothetical protein